MARLHIICGNCGSNDMFSFRVDANGNCGEDGTEYPSVRVFCGNCATLHPLGATIKEDKHTYSDICAALTSAREENERLTAENANLRAAVAGKTFFHSDEEVNAEMGRLRAKVERYGEALKIYADEDQWSSAYMDPWKLRFESRHMDGNGWDTAREALKEPQ